MRFLKEALLFAILLLLFQNDERIAPLSCLPQNNAILSNIFIEWKCILPFHKLIVVNAENGENFPTGKFQINDQIKHLITHFFCCTGIQKNCYINIRVIFSCPIRFNGLPVSDERCGQFG